MHVRHSPGLAAALLMTACDGSVALTNASIAEVATATASIERPEPGQWSTDATLLAFDAGTPPAPGAALMRAQVGATTTTDGCLTPGEARRPLFGALDPTEGATCTFRRFALRGERLDVLMTCRNARGETLEVRQQGRYTPADVDLRATISRRGVDGKPAGGMTTHVVAHRTGDCEEEEAS